MAQAFTDAAMVAAAEHVPSAADLAMDRYASGHDAAFADVYDHVAPRLLSYLRRSVRDQAQLEDLVQATLLQMHRARGSFISGAPVMPWALAIARRLMIDDLRKKKRAPAIADDEAIVRAVAPNTSPDARVEARELAEHLERALDKIPESQRVAFRMLRVEGLSIAEAAALLGTTEASVKLRAHRAYEALKESLARHDLRRR